MPPWESLCCAAVTALATIAADHFRTPLTSASLYDDNDEDGEGCFESWRGGFQSRKGSSAAPQPLPFVPPSLALVPAAVWGGIESVESMARRPPMARRER